MHLEADAVVPDSPPASTPASPWRLRVALFVVVLAALAPFVQPWTAQPGSRYGLTAALVEQQTVRIDDYLAGTAFIDRIEYDGHFYSDKAPGQPFLAVPAYWTARLVGAEPADTVVERPDGSTGVRTEGNLGLWWVTLWSSVIPLALLVVVMHTVAARFIRDTAVQASLALVFGTMFLVLGPSLYGHSLAALVIFGAWALLSSDRPRTAGRLVAAGALAGSAVAVEFPLVLMAGVLALWLIWRDRRVGTIGWYVLGALPLGLFVAWYQAVAFGSPFAVSYDKKEVGQASDTVFGLPKTDVIVNSLVGSRGLFLYSPLVLVGVVAAVVMLRRRARADDPMLADQRVRDQAGMAIAMLGVLLLLVLTRQTNWPNPIGGEVPFVRYVSPALPFLVVPVAWAWRRWRTVSLVSTVIGAAVLVLPLLTNHLIPGNRSVIPWYVERIDELGVVPNLYTLAVGPVGWVVYGLVLGAAVWFLRSVGRTSTARRSVA